MHVFQAHVCYILHVFIGRRVSATHPERRIQYVYRPDHSSIQNNLFLLHLEVLRVFSNLSLRFRVKSRIVNKVTTAIAWPLTLNNAEAFHVSHKLWCCFELHCHLQSGTEAVECFQIKSHCSITDTVVWNMTSLRGLIFIDDIFYSIPVARTSSFPAKVHNNINNKQVSCCIALICILFFDTVSNRSVQSWIIETNEGRKQCVTVQSCSKKNMLENWNVTWCQLYLCCCWELFEFEKGQAIKPNIAHA